jgi:hypothetical protein
MLVLLLREAGRMAICQPCSAHEKRTLIENTDLSDEELRNRQEKAPSLRNASRGSEAFGVPEGLPFKEGVGGGLSRFAPHSEETAAPVIDAVSLSRHFLKTTRQACIFFCPARLQCLLR